jgi:hypothetical protein
LREEESRGVPSGSPVRLPQSDSTNDEIDPDAVAALIEER